MNKTYIHTEPVIYPIDSESSYDDNSKVEEKVKINKLDTDESLVIENGHNN